MLFVSQLGESRFTLQIYLMRILLNLFLARQEINAILIQLVKAMPSYEILAHLGISMPLLLIPSSALAYHAIYNKYFTSLVNICSAMSYARNCSANLCSAWQNLLSFLIPCAAWHIHV
jgi:hypothetical protein